MGTGGHKDGAYVGGREGGENENGEYLSPKKGLSGRRQPKRSLPPATTSTAALPAVASTTVAATVLGTTVTSTSTSAAAVTAVAAASTTLTVVAVSSATAATTSTTATTAAVSASEGVLVSDGVEPARNLLVCFTKKLEKVTDNVAVAPVEEGSRETDITRTTRTTDTMHVRLNRVRHLVVDNEADVLNVDTTSGEIGGHEDIGVSGAQGL